MAFKLDIFEENFPIAGKFTISRGSKTEARVVRVAISDQGWTGQGECVPYARYGETVESVIAEIEDARPNITDRLDRNTLRAIMKPGAARNAVDCALWDLEAKHDDLRVFARLGLTPHPVITAYTLSLGTPEEMHEAAKLASARPLLKIKVGGEGDIERLRAVAEGAPKSRIIVDANEGWNDTNIAANLAECAHLGVVLVEQPLPAGNDSILAMIDHPVLICADESLHTNSDIEGLKGRYDAVNIKLDKAGGLTEAWEMAFTARRLGMKVMIGCMVGTSLGMAPALAIAQNADFVDLDGPLLLAQDREPGLRYEGSVVYPPNKRLWG